MRCTVLLSVLLMACATGGESQDLSAIHLPSADLVPVVLPDNATVLTAPEHSLSRPWALQEEDAHFILWIGAAREEETTIVRASAQKLDGQWSFELMEDPALVPALDWEETQVDHPSVTRSDRYRMAYMGGQGAGIGLATSEDGVLWDRPDNPVLVPEREWEQSGLAYPSLIAEESRYLLYYTDRSGQGLGLAISTDDGESFSRSQDTPLFTPLLNTTEEDVLDLDTAPLRGANVVLTHTALGRPIYSCHYAAGSALGYAASYDGQTFTRFEFNPLFLSKGYAPGPAFRVAELLLHARNRFKGLDDQSRDIGAAYVGNHVAPTAPNEEPE